MIMCLAIPVWGENPKILPNTDIKIDSIRFDEQIGFYEVISGDEIFYISKDMKYVFVGVIIDIASQKNLTEERIISLKSGQTENTDKSSAEIPLDIAVKVGDGKKKVIEFSNPDCSFCRKAHVFFKERKDITRYIFFLSMTNAFPQADKKIEHILCSDNKEQAYNDVYEDSSLPGANKCAIAGDIIQKHKKVAESLGVRVTPYFIINETHISGANLPKIKKLLEK
jgi:thiol:disulfide interchange protein DsbC